ncbi:MAG: hypothetical protein K1X74_04660 [Pirellulales bacterium]|nr:hypothetical protein [Pirellulales bacterium]
MKSSGQNSAGHAKKSSGKSTLRWKRPSIAKQAAAKHEAEIVPVAFEEPVSVKKKSVSRVIRAQALQDPQATTAARQQPTLNDEPPAELPGESTLDLPEEEAMPDLPPLEETPTEEPAMPEENPTDVPEPGFTPVEPSPLEPELPEPSGQDEDLDRELARAPQANDGECPSPRDLKPISQITNSIAAEGDRFPPECTLGNETFIPRCWSMTTYTWKASGLCHKPLYFEEVALERYGHSCHPCLQPFISGAHFFGTLPILPYKMGIETPCECIYPLGYYRPGSCAPHLLYPFPLSLRGALVEGATATGLVFLIP